MKKMIFAVTALALLCFSACKKDDKPETKTTFTATMSGDTFTTQEAAGVNQPPSTTTDIGRTLLITATDTAQNIFTVVIEFPNDEVKTGTYALAMGGVTAISYIHGDDGDVYSSAVTTDPDGNIILSHVSDHHADGTFSGILENANGDRLVVTHGTFSVDL